MRDEQFEQKLISLEAKMRGSIKKISGPDLQQIVVSGLATKCFSHCEMALSSIIAGGLAEAIILLRAGYEAVIRGIYLNENPDKLKDYQAFSAITTLRNQLEVVKILGESGEPYEDKDLQEELIEEQRKKIIDAGYHLLFKLNDADLHSWDGLKKSTNRSNLPNFEEMRRSLGSNPLIKALLTTGFQVYNIGSQMAHSNFEMMTAMVYFDMKHPLYTERAAYRQILLLLLCCCHCFASSGVISATDFEALRTEYECTGREVGLAGGVNG